MSNENHQKYKITSKCKYRLALHGDKEALKKDLPKSIQIVTRNTDLSILIVECLFAFFELFISNYRFLPRMRFDEMYRTSNIVKILGKR